MVQGLIVLVVVLAGIALSVISDASIVDTSSVQDAVTTNPGKTSNSSASATITITMTTATMPDE